MCSPDIAEPSATVRNCSQCLRDGPMAVPMGEAAKRW